MPMCKHMPCSYCDRNVQSLWAETLKLAVGPIWSVASFMSLRCYRWLEVEVLCFQVVCLSVPSLLILNTIKQYYMMQAPRS